MEYFWSSLILEKTSRHQVLLLLLPAKMRMMIVDQVVAQDQEASGAAALLLLLLKHLTLAECQELTLNQRLGQQRCQVKEAGSFPV